METLKNAFSRSRYVSASKRKSVRFLLPSHLSLFPQLLTQSNLNNKFLERNTPRIVIVLHYWPLFSGHGGSLRSRDRIAERPRCRIMTWPDEKEVEKDDDNVSLMDVGVLRKMGISLCCFRLRLSTYRKLCSRLLLPLIVFFYRDESWKINKVFMRRYWNYLFIYFQKQVCA